MKVVEPNKKKEKGVLAKLIKAIRNSKPTDKKYLVVTVAFYDGTDKHFTLTPFKKQGIINELVNLAKGKMVTGGDAFSDAMATNFIPGKRVKSFFITDRGEFNNKERSKFAKNILTRINKKREGAFSHMFT